MENDGITDLVAGNVLDPIRIWETLDVKKK